MRIRVIITIALMTLLFTACGKQQAQKNDSNITADETVIEFGTLCIRMPENFQESTTNGLYLNPDYPDDPSNVYLYTTEKKADFAQIMQNGQQEFVDGLVQNYQKQYGESPEVTVFCYRPAVVGMYNAYEIEVDYTLQGVAYHQLEYIIDAEQTYYVAYTQAGENNWMEIFYNCAAGMYFTE